MRVLLVEDNPRLLEALAILLRGQGFLLDTAEDGIEGELYALSNIHDVLVLDWMLPGKSGLDILRACRTAGIHTPVLMLTARDTVGDRIHGLNAGADDYLVKPFSTDELLARIRALARRKTLELVSEEMVIGNLRFDETKRIISGPAGIVRLVPREASAFDILAARHGKVIGKEQLLERIWGLGAEIDANSVEVCISTLKKKLAAAGADIRISTIRGVGYLLEKVEDQ